MDSDQLEPFSTIANFFQQLSTNDLYFNFSKWYQLLWTIINYDQPSSTLVPLSTIIISTILWSTIANKLVTIIN